MIHARLARLAQLLSTTELEGIALNAGPSLAYFTGLDFHLMERPVILLYLPGGEPVLILPRLEAAKVAPMQEKLISFYYDENPAGWAEVFAGALQFAGVKGKSIGVEPGNMRLLEYNFLQQAAAGVRYLDASPIIAALRSLKDADEIALMQRAVDIAEKALQAVVPLIRRGMTEKELAGELVIQLLRHGSEPTLPFAPIVSSGPNGANPHARPSERKLSEGDCIVVDWGASYGGYVSDLTRTLAVGEVDAECKKIHELVQQANRAGRAAGGVGVTCAEVDRAARKVITDGGYGRFFTHRTGHGLGRECHEEPYMHGDNHTPLQAGMTYTVEPGIYLAGKNGVRIEDDVVITTNGPVSLSNFPREMIEVG
jgi:Xaa-Pro dipeptidase